jgi:hypothetical protein
VEWWEQARAAWRGFGIEVPDGDGPINLPCGYCPIRLNPDGQGEVVWAHRLDPARASLTSIPFPESGYRWGDVVLNDGAPVGYRQVEGREVPVFNAIQLLQRSPFATHVARVRLPDRRDYISRLSQTATRLGDRVPQPVAPSSAIRHRTDRGGRRSRHHSSAVEDREVDRAQTPVQREAGNGNGGRPSGSVGGQASDEAGDGAVPGSTDRGRGSSVPTAAA